MFNYQISERSSIGYGQSYILPGSGLMPYKNNSRTTVPPSDRETHNMLEEKMYVS